MFVYHADKPTYGVVFLARRPISTLYMGKEFYMNWAEIILAIVKIITDMVFLLMEKGHGGEARRLMKLVNYIVTLKPNEISKSRISWMDIDDGSPDVLTNPVTGISEEDLLPPDK